MKTMRCLLIIMLNLLTISTTFFTTFLIFTAEIEMLCREMMVTKINLQMSLEREFQSLNEKIGKALSAVKGDELSLNNSERDDLEKESL